MIWYVLEYRNGSFFQGLGHDNGGPLHTAQTFSSRKEADAFMRKHAWILFNGGMVVPRR